MKKKLLLPAVFALLLLAAASLPVGVPAAPGSKPALIPTRRT
ncbi:hypothetical protein [Cloacibacillus evryensis]|nr:hypothetical protein [Cloacibacillus evryensis]MCQ4762711.1 hypothetical protein [Cloacibacillus evryensis]